MRRRALVSVAGFALGVAALSGCTPDQTLEIATSGPPSGAPADADAGAPPPLPPPVPKVEFSENDFVESDRNRDPFRTYLAVLGSESKRTTRAQRDVILPEHSLDELKLVAIVTGGDYPRAMVIDPGGKGWVIKRGDWIGRPEIVHIGGPTGAEYQLNWRVEKVRDGDVVFTRDDPAQPGIPPASRVIALRTEAEQARDQL